MKPRSCVLAALAILSSTEAWALLDDCEVASTALPFGVYNPASASARDGSGTVTVTCKPGVLASWTISLGPGTGASYTPRRMTSGAASLSYNIYTNAARTIVWGDGSGTTVTVSDSIPLSLGTTTRNYTMYGRIPQFQDSAAGSYSDSILVTLLF